jgi:thioredoxin reductase
LYARQLNLPFTIYEQGRIGEHVWRWGHVKLFTPFSANATPLGRQAIRSLDAQYEFPADDECITGREYVERYLKPIAEVLDEELQTETRVINIARAGMYKQEAVGESGRAKLPFVLLVREKNLDRYEEADIILDCTGTYSHHRWLGQSGIPALGETAVEPHIAYHLADVLGDAKKDFLNKSILVVGAGYSAATTVTNLSKLAKEHNMTWITWVTRANLTQPMRRIANDPWRERDRLAVAANTLATRNEGNVEFHANTIVESIEPLNNNQSFRVKLNSGEERTTFEVEKIIANVGYTPDRAIFRELQIHESYDTFAPMKIASALAIKKASDCATQVCPPPDSLRNPEPNFYILGAKSFGRNAQFVMRNGFEQVRDVFTLITGNAKLDLQSKR